ncbi:nucleotide sugar dehydrogenase [Moritella sp. Urea-trap-13]|uniref:nucleotide sugar dehydrogenase n=1 Tax=Moritella sp. Urea-trap-13 TaxID=2058327 RepID=UPI000C33CF69|nr:UDP-glucose/GDP-mannose dehydrogenase family protein [Moritella sp. Urea-trap-13]PKH07919.1 GDP-mannose dehydrogenase [Moritella sp. Urea-trap-13]
MRVSVFGMGYVGAVCTACLANRGHQIIGVDVVQEKVDIINAGRSPIVEEGLEELLLKGVKSKKISATINALDAVMQTDISFVAVPTPSKPNGDLNLGYVQNVCKQIGEAIKVKGCHHTVVIRSTVLPGSVMGVIRSELESATGMTAGVDFGLAVNPEFLRESTAIDDYDHPPMTVVGCLDEVSAQQLTELYSDLDAPLFIESIETAEMVKYTCNVWHAIKVTFANEIGSIAKASGVDGRKVMDIICTDTKLNISAYYMKPGFAFGGSCLPKDVRALNYRASQLNVKHPLIASVMESNENHVKNVFHIIENTGKKRVALYGLSFKPGTDDLRESPHVELAEMLLGKGYTVKIYDENVSYAKIHGSNKEYLENKIPHISSLLQQSKEDMLHSSELVIIGNSDKSFHALLEKISEHHVVLDLCGLIKGKSDDHTQGICW